VRALADAARNGKDEAARMLIQGLTERGVDCAHVTRASARSTQTGSATIIVSEATGDNMVIVVPGANHAWSTAKRKSMQTVVRTAKVVCLQVACPLYIKSAGNNPRRSCRMKFRLTSRAPRRKRPQTL